MWPRKKDLIWIKFNKLQVLEFAWIKNKHATRTCICDCWKIISTTTWMLTSNWITNCWCSKNIDKKTHWMSNTRFYSIRKNMKTRCYNKNIPEYKWYWLLWIKCLRKSFEEFYSDMYKDYLLHIEKYWENQTTLDKINNNLSYSKNNCRRATRKEQWVNKRHKRIEQYSLQNVYIKTRNSTWEAEKELWTAKWAIYKACVWKENRKQAKWYIWKYL